MHLLNHSMLKSNSLERISGELLTRSFSYSALRTYMHIPTKKLLTRYIMYYIKKGNYNPVIGIAAVSCVPTTAKVAQKIVSKDNPDSFILGDALGANISGVITSAIITGIYITIIPLL